MNPFRAVPRVLTGGILALLGALGTVAHANVSLRAGNMAGGNGTGSSSAAATSQTASAATASASQAQQTAAVAANAQAALTHSLQALQSLQKAQGAARQAAIAGLNNLGADPNHPGQQLPNVSDGLGAGALMPTGGLTTTPNSAIQVVQLGNNNTVTLSQGGTVVLPTGTSGSDQVAITGAGSVSGGTVTANAGSVTTSSGGTLATTTGGTVTVSGAGSTLTYSSATSISSTAAGTITLPNGGGTVALAANQTAIIPAGGTLTFSGSGAATVSLVGPGTVTLTGAGTLALTNVGTAAAGGTITTRSGTTSFTSGATTSVAAGSSIDLTGSGTLDFTSSSGDDIPILLPSTNNAVSNPAANFTTTGTLLSTTGYQVPTSWTNIGALSQTANASTGQITDTITQEAQQAVLYWSSFNIGKNTTLDFDQSAGGANVGQWVAINEIQDPSLSPSQILGSIEAPGQVYVINQNGIIFGGSSQVNTHGLVASSLALNPDYITNGLLNDSQNNFEFQFSALAASTAAVVGVHGKAGTPASLSPLWTAPSGASSQTVIAVPTGDVTVQAGAQLTSPSDGNGDGGRIALIAPNVVNDGTISTPDGQTILAAGLQVGFAAHDADDPTDRGLDVYVGQASTSAAALPTGTFVFNGLPGGFEGASGLPIDDELTLSGSGQVGTYTPPGGQATPIMGGTATTIPVGSSVTLTGGTQTFAAVNAGTVTNAAQVTDASGNIVTPGGDIEALEADVTMAGATVNQFGLINASTSVTLNGRIDLLADYDAKAILANGSTSFSPLQTGTVEFGANSVTQILPELSSSETTFGSQLALSSLVNVQGLTLEMDPGSLLYAPSASAADASPALDFVGATLSSGITFNAGTWFQTSATSSSTFSNSTGNIILGAGSTIDVSGSENVAASVADNIIAVQLRGPELADSPLQQNGALRGQTVYVDIRDTGVYDGTAWIGTPLGDISGYVNDISHTVGELTTNGGTVALNAGGSITDSAGATINVSGGWINYAGADVQTTQVITNGNVIDISQATPNLVYEGIYTGYTSSSAKYGISQTYANSLANGPVYEAGYVQGGDGGKITIIAPSVTLAGTVAGNTVIGPYQVTPLAQIESTYAGTSFLPVTEQVSAIPSASSLTLDFFQRTANGAANVYAATSSNITFQTDAELAGEQATPGNLLLSQDIVNEDGFGNLTIDTTASGSISIPEGVSLVAPLGGDISLSAANISIDGSISAPGGGSLTFEVLNISPQNSPQFSTPSPYPDRGVFTLGSTASLSSTGLVVDENSNTDSPIAISGGAISISGLDVDLLPGSTIDVSGGMSLSSAAKETFGSAGSISILGGADPALSSLVTGGQLVLGSTLTGYSGLAGGGGSLTIQSPLVQIGGSTLLNGDGSTAPLVSGEAGVVDNGTTLWLDRAGSSADFFGEGGFANFTIKGLGRVQTNGAGVDQFDASGNPVILPAVLVASGTTLDPVVQGFIASFSNGAPVLTPLTTAQENELLPSQRSALNLVLDAEGVVSGLSDDFPPEAANGSNQNTTGGGLLVRGDLVFEAGASIVTDPQVTASHGVSLLAPNGMVAVLGLINAPGGTITIQGGSTQSLSSNQLLFYNSAPDAPFPTVDLGPDSLLSVAGEAELTYNGEGFLTGSVLPGGNIVLKGNIVAESGATLNVSGASAVLQETPASLGSVSNSILSTVPIATTVDSNGGSIALDASQLLYDDATMLGNAGGSSAVGGSLSVSSGFADTVNPNMTQPLPIDVDLIISQNGLNGGFSLPAGAGSGLALLDGQTLPTSAADVGSSVNSAVGGEPVYSYFSANSNLFLAANPSAGVGNNNGRAGGFVSLSLSGTLDFVGPVSITTSSSLSVAKSSGSGSSGETGGVIYADAPVVLTAPYVALNAYETSYLPDLTGNYPGATSGLGSLTVNAAVLADVGNISLQDIGELSFNADSGAVGDIRGSGTLQVAGDIAMNAGQIYPPTESTFTIEADDVHITAPTGQPLPELPLSGAGTLNIEAATIEQDGVLRAPLGQINIGTSATQSITLGAGSITSVSAVDPLTGVGLTIPYGIVDSNGNWFDPDGNNITLTGPPAAAIHITGQEVNDLSGSTIDLTGGGNLLAYQFTAGTGGNKDILASTGTNPSSTSFAILPGYSQAYAPTDPYNFTSNNLTTNGVVDAGYTNANLAVGEQVHLDGSTGLPAGTYTLLPARYALLPGAFLVQAAGGAPAGTSIVQPDGSAIVAGYLTSGLNPTSSPVYTGFLVGSESYVLSQAPYTIELANTFFPASAAANNLSASRLPLDAGQLVLDATRSMTVEGMLLSQPAAGGLGGEVDIASPEDIYITGPNATGIPSSGALVLDSAQLTNFDAADLLIGGYRTTTDTGTTVTVTTDNLVVDNAGSSAVLDGVTTEGLAASDVTLVSNDSLTLADGAVIEQLGPATTGAPTLTLQGNGTLLRVSSDPTAAVDRQNVTGGDTTSILTIGAGVQIVRAGGGVVGSLVLDSTDTVLINPSTTAPPVLEGQNLTLDSGFINLELGTPATAPTSGLIITEPQLQSLLASTQALSLLSYSSIALYGSGDIGTETTSSTGQPVYQDASLALHADDIYYADSIDSNGITINAQNVSLDNLAGGALLPSLTNGGRAALTINAQTISLGANALRLDQFNTVTLNASSAILLTGLGTQSAGSDNAPTPASLTAGADLILNTPLITAAASADEPVTATTTAMIDEEIEAGGTLTIQAPTGDSMPATQPQSLGSSLSLVASTIIQNSGSIVLHSGSLNMEANGLNGSSGEGNITIDGSLDVSGTASTIFSLTNYTNGGNVSLDSANGTVAIGASGEVNVGAVSGVGSLDSQVGEGGSVAITAAGSYLPGRIEGEGSVVTEASSDILAEGSGGTLSLDVAYLSAGTPGQGTLSTIETGLSGFSEQTIRDRDDATVAIDTTVTARNFVLSSDQGSIVVSGGVNASDLSAGGTGGTIDLEAAQSITLLPGSMLSVAANQLDDAGEGGSITLAAGSYEGNSVATSSAAINVMNGAQIQLGVSGADGGTLLLRAPQVSGGAYVAGTSYQEVPTGDFTSSNGGTPDDVAIASISNSTIQNAGNITVEGFYVQDAKTSTALIDNAEAAAENNATTFMSNAGDIQTRIFGSNVSNVNIEPGEEIDNSTGSLELAATWNFSTLRYGALSEPGVLTIRAAGNLNIDFGASLNDGFDGSQGVNNENLLLAIGSRSWSYNLVAGADFTAAEASAVQTSEQLQAEGTAGSFQLGYQDVPNPLFLSDFVQNNLSVFFQTIRTGTGDISINAGGDVLLLNDLATIYTAGSQVDGTLDGTFMPPSGTDANSLPLPAMYSSGGGNVAIAAQGNIEREVYSGDGSTLVADSSAELPTNWLDREGAVSNGQIVTPTTWWVDFSNFFEGVGALGGGNVTLDAGNSIVNVDAAIPTNARLINGQLTELGGGDLTLSAGTNIDGGVYYVERGQGTLAAGNNIQTNATRAAVSLGEASTPIDWLPTTLFLGQGGFQVSAAGNLLLGPVANPFLLPQSYNNIASRQDTTSEISYFSTYAATDAVNADSLSGTVTIQDYADGGEGSLYAWYTNILDASVTGATPGSEVSATEPWLLLAEATNPQHVISDFGPAGVLPLGSPDDSFEGVTALLPPTLRVDAYSGDIDLIGTLTLTPSASGTVDLVAGGSINAFQVNSVQTAGIVSSFGGSGLIDLSDANPAALPGIDDPLSLGTELSTLDPLFTATGATNGLTLQQRQLLHADIDNASLHASDPNPDPVYIYAGSGDISGLNLFSAKDAQVIAGQDITDIGLYIQNNSADDISVVSAGRDIIAYDAASPLREEAGTNLIGYSLVEEPLGDGAGAPNSGDIQISGPGALEVLAGRNITLGNDVGQNPNDSNPGDGLFTGLTSVGDEVNPALPFGGATLVAAAGLGDSDSAAGLSDSSLTFSTFISEFLDPSGISTGPYLTEIASDLDLDDPTSSQAWNAFEVLPSSQQDAVALDAFYVVLRDAGRNHNNPNDPGFGNYDAGYAAISALFPASNSFQGNIDITSREIKTTNDSSIDLLVPGGQVTVGIDQPGTQAVDQGILTVDGGNISIMASGNVNVGTSRIFTLHGGNIIIWSTNGNIAAGASSKTVVSAPPTLVRVDPTSGDVTTDLAGLATGGGIGVLAPEAGIPAGDIDLIAPSGIVDAGDAGIRATGNLNIAAVQVLNASNISVGGKSVGVSSAPSLNVGALAAASSVAGSTQQAASNTTPNHPRDNSSQEETPSTISVEVLGYGGGDEG